MPLGDCGQALAVRGEQGLVGGDHGFAGGERGLDRELGRTCGAADHLDQSVYCRIARQRRGIGNPAEFAGIKVALLMTRSRADGDDLYGTAAPRNKLVTAALKQVNDRAADRAKAGKTDFQRLRHDASPGLRGEKTQLTPRRVWRGFDIRCPVTTNLRCECQLQKLH